MLLRYLLSPISLVILDLTRILITIFLFAIVNLLNKMSFETVVILILLGVLSISLGFMIIGLLFSGISWIGRKSMQLMPNKIVFWVLLSFYMLSIILVYVFTDYNDSIPVWVDFLIIVLVLSAYSYGGYALSKEEEELVSPTVKSTDR